MSLASEARKQAGGWFAGQCESTFSTPLCSDLRTIDKHSVDRGSPARGKALLCQRELGAAIGGGAPP